MNTIYYAVNNTGKGQVREGTDTTPQKAFGIIPPQTVNQWLAEGAT